MSVLFSLLSIPQIFPEYLLGARPAPVAGVWRWVHPGPAAGSYGPGHYTDPSLQSSIHMMPEGNACSVRFSHWFSQQLWCGTVVTPGRQRRKLRHRFSCQGGSAGIQTQVALNLNLPPLHKHVLLVLLESTRRTNPPPPIKDQTLQTSKHRSQRP